MFEKSFITDCEGPLTLNDNAYELAVHFIENGGELFKVLSLYDDYLADIVKKENYKVGNTLKFILPFFVCENLKNQDIEALSNYMDFPFENTFYTKVDVDALTLNDEEMEKITKFKQEILSDPENYELFDEIFYSEIPKMGIYEAIEAINVVGGEGKKEAIDEIIERDNINTAEILYIGDSITDVEPLDFARKNNGISISFNGNEYPLKVAEIAIVSPSAITTCVMANIYAKDDKQTVLRFIDDYNASENLEELFEKYGVDLEIKNRFLDVFSSGEYPIIKIIDDDNFEDILKVSKDMRNNIRGQDIGELG